MTNKFDFGAFRVRWISLRSNALVRSSLESEGFRCFDLRPSSSKNDFLEALRVCFVLQCDVKCLTSWDSASDFLWESLMEQPSNKVAIFWHGTNGLLDGGLQFFTDCLEFLGGVAEIAERQEQTVDCHPVLLRIVLLGEGVNFHDVD